MSNPIGNTFIYNFIILFIVIVFGFLAGTMSYYKAYKINNRIVHAIEKFEGYNSLAKAEIDKVLGTFGYSVENLSCVKERNNMTNVSLGENYRYCIYISDTSISKGEYYRYGVLTYMNIDLPVVNRINIPVFTRTNQIYKFTNKM